MVTGGQGALLSGESLEAAVRAVLPRRPSAIGVNCVDPPGISRDLVLLAGLETGVPLVAYGNVLSTGEDPEAYADAARRWISAGTAIVGGCCGTTPAHTRALRELLDGLTGRPTVGPGPRA
jgi:methionine synthase I (cobalamin-dependent)